MENLMILLMAPVNLNNGGGSIMSSLIMFFIITAIPLSWVIPYIIRKNRNKQTLTGIGSATAKTQIEQLKDLAELKEKGILTEEEFIAQKNKILGR
jgi:cytochrome c-type biogenesis protein CcmH/NrfG